MTSEELQPADPYDVAAAVVYTLRKQAGEVPTQQQLANLLCVTQPQVSQYLNGSSGKSQRVRELAIRAIEDIEAYGLR
jgi:predicted transcriptional regulator